MLFINQHQFYRLKTVNVVRPTESVQRPRTIFPVFSGKSVHLLMSSTPMVPQSLHYSFSCYPHRQPLTDDEAGRQNVLPYYTHVVLCDLHPPHAEINMPLNLPDCLKITCKKNILFLCMDGEFNQSCLVHCMEKEDGCR